MTSAATLALPTRAVVGMQLDDTAAADELRASANTP
jgi:hypothetical protein